MSCRRFRPPVLGALLLVLVGVATTGASAAAGRSANAVGPVSDDPRPGTAALFGASPETILAGAVNDPSADATAQDTQSSTTVAGLGDDVVVGFNDSGSDLGGANEFTGYSQSANKGASFTDEGALPTSAFGDAGEPALATDEGTGAVYLATIAFSPRVLPVYKSTNGGVSFGAPVNGLPGGGSSLDKPWLAVDNFAGAGNGDVYLCATDFTTNPAHVVLTHSVDGGASFGPSGGAIVSSSGQSQGCQVAVGPDHSVYVAYFRGTSSNALFIRRSIDGGASFGIEHRVAALNTTSINGNLGLSPGFRTNSFPSLAVDPQNGELVVTYNDDPDLGDSADNGDVYATWSTDLGATWATPVAVNNDLAGDQWMPTVAISPNGRHAFFGYYSRADDLANFDYHRRGRIEAIHTSGGGELTASGRSFRLGPNTPPALGQDPHVNTVYMGDSDQATAPTNRAFYSTWADNRAGDSFHAHQPDVHFAKVTTAQPRTNLGVVLNASPATLDPGQQTTLTAHVRSTGGTADDAFLNLSPAADLTFKSVSSSGNHCRIVDGFIGCSMDDIRDGTVEDVDIVATAGFDQGTHRVKANATTSSVDTERSDDTGTAEIIVNPGTFKTKTYSSGNLSLPIADNSTTDVPITVGPHGTIADADALVRIDHTFDGDLDLSLISPHGTAVDLSSGNGGNGDNYGAGSLDCAGTPTEFDDGATTSIVAGAAPFAGTFKPEQPLSALNGEQEAGTWTLRVSDHASEDTGTIGCGELRIRRLVSRAR